MEYPLSADFQWNEKGRDAKSESALKKALRLLSVSERLWSYYQIQQEGRGVRWLKPGFEYTLVFCHPDNVRFVWPRNEHRANPDNRGVLEKAFRYAGLAELCLDPDCYFIASKRDAPALTDIEEDALLIPGRTYVLRVR